MNTANPPGWPRPKGYSNAVVASGELVFVAGQIGWDSQGKLVGAGFVEQLEKALENVVAVLSAAGARPEHLARVTIYLTDKRRYLAEAKRVGEVWRRVLGPVYPAMSLVEVKDLLEEGALVEVEATAVKPAG